VQLASEKVACFSLVMKTRNEGSRQYCVTKSLVDCISRKLKAVNKKPK
jgi:hypothetical protein